MAVLTRNVAKPKRAFCGPREMAHFSFLHRRYNGVLPPPLLKFCTFGKILSD